MIEIKIELLYLLIRVKEINTNLRLRKSFCYEIQELNFATLNDFLKKCVS